MYQLVGKTYPHRNTLRNAGCRWNAQDKVWETRDFQLAERLISSCAGVILQDAIGRPIRREVPKDDIRIEYPSRGATYFNEEYGVYKYGIYPRNSVLAGRTSRQFLGSYSTLEEARTEYPEAEEAGCGYQAPYLNHLPEEDY